MNNVVLEMARAYPANTLADQKNCLREISQEIILSGLSRAGFFQHAAFYGGTALRIFHGLDRFSEDLDFSLMVPDPAFSLDPFLPFVEKEAAAYGFNFEGKTKTKTRESATKSAFLKGNTREHLLELYPNQNLAASIPASEVIRIKLEIDIDPAPGATFERQYRLLPLPFEVNLYDAPSLFAGKIHAVLCRAWRNRVKGRDLYDYVFYRRRKTPVNMPHLEEKLKQTGFLGESARLDIAMLQEKLFERFETIDYRQAREDVLPFVSRTESLELWSPEFFKSISKGIEAA